MKGNTTNNFNKATFIEKNKELVNAMEDSKFLQLII